MQNAEVEPLARCQTYFNPDFFFLSLILISEHFYAVMLLWTTQILVLHKTMQTSKPLVYTPKMWLNFTFLARFDRASAT